VDPLAQTSRWMAAARARESERHDRLFDDPLAAAFASREGFVWLNRMERTGSWSGSGLYVVIRTRFFDDFLLRSAWSGDLRQIVLVAAGMDARAFRLDWPPHTRMYELDRPEVLATKEGVVARSEARATCERHTIGVDLARPSWSQAFQDAGYETREPAAWLMEGLIFYLTEASARMLLDEVSALAATRSRLGADLVNRDLLISPMMWPLLTAFARHGVAGRFGTNNPETLLAERGWEAEVTQPGEQEANYGRWPYPVAPREVPGIPRIFLVRARRV
jgi:methyltransferase (TIGR00027 family)